MKKFNKILRYLIPYWEKAALNILFNLLSVVFGLFSITMVIPFLGILFKNQPVITDPEPFRLTIESIEHNFNYYVSQLILNKGETYALVFVSGVAIVMSFLKTGFKYLAMYNLAPLRNGVVRDIRNTIFAKILILPVSYFSSERKGDVLARMTGDVKEIERSLISSLEMLFRDPLTILIYVITLFIMSPRLTLFVIVLLPVSGFIIGRIGRNLRATALKGQNKMGLMMSMIEETLSGLRIIKSFNAEKKVSKRFLSMNNLYNRIMIKMYRKHYLANPTSEFLGTFVVVVIMWFGGSLVLNENTTLSSQAFIGYLLIFTQIINPSKSFSTAYYNMLKGMASADRIDVILEAEEKIVQKPDARPIKGFHDSIEYRNVTFAYGDKPVLIDINLSIEKGKTIALVGQSGSGKSTIADLLPRFYDPVEGDVLIDGLPIRDYKIADVRNLMGMVQQESILFNDNFFNNIAFGMENISEKDVMTAAKVANAHLFIEKSPNGYFTNVGEGGNKLSGGEKQRISIARAILKNPPIMILDEATSSLDTESEKLVQDALSNLMKNRTSLVIAHRLSTIRNADEICVLHEGRIVERGKHEELMKKDGYYRKLHNLQTFA